MHARLRFVVTVIELDPSGILAYQGSVQGAAFERFVEHIMTYGLGYFT